MIKGSFTGPTGQTPAMVAATVLDAIRSKRFWILTHPDARPTVRERADEIVKSFPPDHA